LVHNGNLKRGWSVVQWLYTAAADIGRQLWRHIAGRTGLYWSRGCEWAVSVSRGV